MKLKLLLLFILLPYLNYAQTIYPVPHQVKVNGSVSYTGVKSKADLLKKFETAKGIPVNETKANNLAPEGYELNLAKDKIELRFATARGKFYAYKTLAQVLANAKQSGKLWLTSIKDAPDVAFRGTVEGFYGQPWSYDDRVSQLKFYGDWKMNTYIYGPKDDPYHSSPKWREPYPTEEANMLKQLVTIAKQNHVDFYWAIHPGKDIQWNNKDSVAVLNKFEMMYNLGVRHFAVFFDDISGEGTKAEKQAGLLNYLQKQFLDKKTDAGSLIMCPTEYNKSWSDPKEGTYLDILGAQLDPRIHIMWTGNTVVHDITKEGQAWVNKRIKRPSFVWWNFPVNDYVRNHLVLGSAYGLDLNIKNDMSGFVSNPMDKPEASKVAIFSVANYTWNLSAYKPNETWVDAIKTVMPGVAKSYQLFSSHNTDPGPSYHQYRKIESESIASTLNFLQQALAKGTDGLPKDSLQKLRTEFQKFEPAVNDLLKNAKNTKLISEIKPWLSYFSALGKASLALLNTYQDASIESAYGHFKKFQDLRNQMISIDQENNKNPYQPGVVGGSRHILPWIEQSYLHYYEKFKKAGYQVPNAVNQVSGKVYTNIAQLSALPVQTDVITANKAYQVLKLARMLEVVTFKAGDYLGIEILSKSKVKEVRFKAANKVDGVVVQYSDDAKDWASKKSQNTKYVRIVNSSNADVAVGLNQFEIVFE